MDDGKSFYREMVRSVRDKRDRLHISSHLRNALTDRLLAAIDDHINQTALKDLLFGYWPPVFGLIDTYPDNVVAELDADIRLVVSGGKLQKENEITRFLHARPKDKPGQWYGGLFDVWAKASALKTGLVIELDHVLPNGRDHDILLHLGGRNLHLENTVITQNDEARDVWDRFLMDKRQEPDKVLVRPGAYCPVNAKGPSLYYDALRMYAKVFDKLAKDLDPSKTQCADGEPNILLLSFAGLGMRADSPSVGWVLDELFADQPKMVHTVAPDGMTDISLDAWIDFTARDLISRRKMTVDFYCENFGAIMAMPRKLGAIMLFDGSKLVGSRVNYNADEGCQVGHREIVALEELLSSAASYWL